MAGLFEQREERIKKRVRLIADGLNPYLLTSQRTHEINGISTDFAKLSKRKGNIIMAGRIMSIRTHGGSTFINIFDGTGTFQIYFKKDVLKKDSYEYLVDTVDRGDFIEAKGSLFVTKKKEKTLLAKDYKILTKSLRPLPEKWHGLTDTEERFRKRYLDILMSEQVRGRFELRSKVITSIRESLSTENFLEVETPTLQPIPGGATALPFMTHHNALDIDLFLRIAPELYLKELLIAGYPRVYEIGKSFRNEGIDASHNPEFTTVEAYVAYESVESQMLFIEKIFRNVLHSISKRSPIPFNDHKISFSKKFRRITYEQVLKQYALIGPSDWDKKDNLALKAKQFGIHVAEHDDSVQILENIYKKKARPNIIEPTYITDYPKKYAPLAKEKESKPELVELFQLVAGGLELVKGYAELNDPIEQHARFLEQEQKRSQGNAEAQIKDDNFIEALEYGMPPATGWAIGIDRLVMLLTDTHNIKEVVLFPTMRPKK